LPRVYISSPLDALRTFNLASIYICKKVFQSVLAFTRSKARRTSSLSRLHSLKGEEDLFFCLEMHESAEGLLHYWCLRSPKDDEVFKTFNYCHRSPKNDGDFKTFNYCHRSPKNDEDFKTFNYFHRSPKNDWDFKTFNYEACNITLMLP